MTEEPSSIQSLMDGEKSTQTFLFVGTSGLGITENKLWEDFFTINRILFLILISESIQIYFVGYITSVTVHQNFSSARLKQKVFNNFENDKIILCKLVEPTNLGSKIKIFVGNPRSKVALTVRFLLVNILDQIINKI